MSTPASTSFPAGQLLAWSRGGPITDEPKRFPERFAREVAARPEAIAVVAEGGAVTFTMLDALSNRLAHHLRTGSVAANQTVALCLGRSLELVVAVLAVFKAGGTVFMLDPAAPPERQSALLALTRPRLVLTDAASVARLPPEAAMAAVRLDAPAAAWRTESTASLPCAIEPEHRAIYFQTSGSTGTPKIVVERYGYWRGPATWVAGDRTLLKSNAGTTFSLVEAMAVITGATVVVVPAGLEQDFPGLAAFIEREGITSIVFSASALRVLVDCVSPSLANTLKTVICIGERIAPELKTLVAARLPGVSLVVGYGCTEARGATARACQPTDDPRVVDVGRPGLGMEVLVLDEQGGLCALGQAGEIYLGGQLAEGYLDDPATTAAAFVPHPWDPRPGTRLFRTRDQGCMLPDGTLEVRGRLDHQVKIRGYRVETGEVEAALTRLPGVGMAAVIRREDRPGDERLVAYLAPPLAGPPLPERAELRQHLHGVLPPYAVPTAYVVLAALPLTSTGKIDRRALAALPGPAAALATGASSRVPTSTLEILVARIWCEALGLEAIGCDDNFFDLGGHSLLAARIASAVEAKTGHRMPGAVLFRAPTVATLARWLAGEAGSGSLVPIRAGGDRPPLFCVHGMKGDAFTFVYLARQLASSRPVYGLQARDLDGPGAPHESIEAMAVDYAREIRAAYPSGPYHLVGYSLGGWIAYAVAQELTRQGSRMGMLALLDTATLARLPLGLRIVEDGRRRYALARFHLRHHRVYLQRYADKIFRGRRPDRPATADVRRLPVEPAEPIDPHLALVARYAARSYAGDVTVFRAEQTPPAKLRFWTALVKGRLTRRTVNGDHGAFLDEANAGVVAAALDTRLTELEATGR